MDSRFRGNDGDTESGRVCARREFALDSRPGPGGQGKLRGNEGGGSTIMRVGIRMRVILSTGAIEHLKGIEEHIGADNIATI